MLVYLTALILKLGSGDRAATAADPRRAARGRRAAVLLARVDQRADHEPARGARGRERTEDVDEGSTPTGSRGQRRACVLYFGTYERDYPRNAQVISRRAGPASRWSSGTSRSGRDAATGRRPAAARPRGSVRGGGAGAAGRAFLAGLAGLWGGGDAARAAGERGGPVVRVLYFGTYERDYPRNAQGISGLRRRRRRGANEHFQAVGGGRRSSPPTRRPPASCSPTARAALARRRLRRVLVGYPGHFDLTAARRASRGRPVVFNPLVSLADTFVADRGRLPRRLSTARMSGGRPRTRFGAADLVVADSDANADHLRRAGRPRARSSRSASSAPRSASSGPGGSRRRNFVRSSSAS